MTQFNCLSISLKLHFVKVLKGNVYCLPLSGQHPLLQIIVSENSREFLAMPQAGLHPFC